MFKLTQEEKFKFPPYIEVGTPYNVHVVNVFMENDKTV